jgi:predicted PurR-regulated permease PerM
MVQWPSIRSEMNASARFSFFFMAGAILLIGWLQLAGPLLVGCFTFLALTCLQLPVRGGKIIAVLIVLLLLSGLFYGLGYFVHATIQALPEIGDQAIPAIITWAKSHDIQLPFSDYDSLKDFALDTIKGETRYLGNFTKFARGASTHFVFLAAGCIVAMGFFLNPQFGPRRDDGAGENLYEAGCREVAARFQIFYQSFTAVMGAQILISAVNTVLTGIFVVAVGLPYAVVVIGMTFLCGLLPIVGNLVSNSIVVSIGFTVSPKMAFCALVFLVVIHKLEYLLNSKIVGWRIRNPFWLTLLALIVGERMLGIPGMILGPVLLNYIRQESSRFKTRPSEPIDPKRA